MNDFCGCLACVGLVTLLICTVFPAGVLALKLVESLAKLVGIILAASVALTGQVVDHVKRKS